MKKTTLILLLLFAVIISLILSCAKEIKKEKPIKIGLNMWPGYAHAFIAQEKGFFKKNKVNVELVYRREYSEIEELYNNGEIDGCFEVFSDVLFDNEEGIPTKVVYVADYSDSADVIIANPKYRSLRDLKGKIIGVDGINSFSHMFVLKALEKAGVSEVDARFDDVPAQEVLAALDKGIISAGHTWEPAKSAALKKGYKILAKAGDVPGLISDVLVFNAEVIDERRDEVQEIVSALVQAKDFVSLNKDEAIRIMADKEGMSRTEMENGLKGVYQPDLKENIAAMKKGSAPAYSLYEIAQEVSEFYLNRGQLSREPDFNLMVEPKFLEQVVKERKE